MAYKVNPSFGNLRDKLYPSEIAAQRPALATRILCEESPYREESKTEEQLAFEREMRIREDEREPSIRGSRGDNRCEEFNRALRAGHAFRNEGDE